MINGITFASRAEAALYQDLTLQKIAFTCQEKVYLTKANILFKPDFKEISKAVYFEMKGAETATWRIKRKLWKFYGPGILLVYKMKGNKPYLFETITPVESACE